MSRLYRRIRLFLLREERSTKGVCRHACVCKIQEKEKNDGEELEILTGSFDTLPLSEVDDEVFKCDGEGLDEEVV